MKKLLFLLFITTGFLYGNMLLDATTAKGEKSFIITLNFDDEILNVEEKIEQNQIFITIKNFGSKKPYIFTPNSDLISSIRINQDINKIVVHIVPKKSLALNKNILNNNRTLSLELSAKIAPTKTEELANKISVGSDALNLEENFLYMFLFIASLLLLWIIIKLAKGGESGSWLMGKSKLDSFEIIQQKTIDSKNKIVVVRFKGMNYILLIGQSALLIDHYEDGKDLTTNEFDNLLKGSSAKLTDFMLDKR